ncbi:Uncharacterised protein [uncultured archaeon]|nr:Uncharacterised protein [uncultured archaeon]
MFKLFGHLKKDKPSDGQPANQNQNQGNPSAPQQAPNRPHPEDRVAYLVSQGLAEPEIIKVLKDEGYSFQEIDSGITNVLKSRVSNEPPVSAYGFGEGAQPEDLAPVFRPNPQEVVREEAAARSKAAMIEEMEEIIETLIEEKLSGVLDELDKTEKRFAEVNEKLRQVNERILALENQEKNTDASQAEKINAVGQKEENIEPRIASLEKAFKDIVPNLVESIREMRETVASLRRREAPMPDVERSAEESSGFEAEKDNNKSSIFD